MFKGCTTEVHVRFASAENNPFQQFLYTYWLTTSTVTLIPLLDDVISRKTWCDPGNYCVLYVLIKRTVGTDFFWPKQSENRLCECGASQKHVILVHPKKNTCHLGSLQKEHLREHHQLHKILLNTTAQIISPT